MLHDNYISVKLVGEREKTGAKVKACPHFQRLRLKRNKHVCRFVVFSFCDGHPHLYTEIFCNFLK